jgi:SAM-dependent methyltransferase
MFRDDAYNDACLRGEQLYGDDFSADEIACWFACEREGFADLWGGTRDAFQYEYFALNHFHGFRFLPERRFRRVLGFGSAYGDELAPIAHRCDEITILDPSEKFRRSPIQHPNLRSLMPEPSGTLQFPAQTFDLVVSFGVLHHVPNASFVLREFARTLQPGGWVLLREPIVSMGDWRRPRRGLTRNERGFPPTFLHQAIADAGLVTISSRYCVFPAIPRLQLLGIHRPYNAMPLVIVDWIAATVTSRNSTYHPTNLLGKVAPQALAFVLRKPN